MFCPQFSCQALIFTTSTSRLEFASEGTVIGAQWLCGHHLAQSEKASCMLERSGCLPGVGIEVLCLFAQNSTITLEHMLAAGGDVSLLIGDFTYADNYL